MCSGTAVASLSASLSTSRRNRGLRRGHRTDGKIVARHGTTHPAQERSSRATTGTQSCGQACPSLQVDTSADHQLPARAFFVKSLAATRVRTRLRRSTIRRDQVASSLRGNSTKMWHSHRATAATGATIMVRSRVHFLRMANSGGFDQTPKYAAVSVEIKRYLGYLWYCGDPAVLPISRVQRA